MNAQCGVNGVILSGQGNGLPAFPEIRPNGYDRVNTGLFCPEHDFVPVMVKIPHLQMGVGINEHRLFFFRPIFFLR